MEYTMIKDEQRQGKLESPEVRVDSVNPIDSRTVVLRWHSPYQRATAAALKRYYLQVKNFSTGADWLDVDDHIPANVTTYTVRYLAPAMTYGFQLAPVSEHGPGLWHARNITMPPDVPPQVSWVHLMATTNETLLFGWRRPSHDNGANIQRYTVQLHQQGGLVANETLKVLPDVTRNNLMYIFVNLVPGSPYIFQVQACSTLGCGEWSETLAATTADGMADQPSSVEMKCFNDLEQNLNYVVVTWTPPVNIRGSLIGYNISLEGEATFRGIDGDDVVDHFKESGDTKANIREFKSTLRPNTNYTTQVCAVNRAGCGHITPVTSQTSCTSPSTVPSMMPEYILEKPAPPEICSHLKLKLKKVSERNGLIRCYRIVVIRLRKGDNIESLPTDPLGLNLSTHPEVHVEDGYGAYLAETFASEHFMSELMLGDGKFGLCEPVVSPTLDLPDNGTVYDGKLLPDTNYSGFVEVQVWGPNGTIMTKQSSYFNPMQTGCSGASSPSSAVMQESPVAFIIGVVCGILVVLLILVLVLCLLRRKAGQSYPEVDGEQIGLSALIKRSKVNQFASGNHVAKTLHMGPIPIEDLAAAYIERHVDNELLFREEFESLPDTFRGRTTEAAESSENVNKNRHADIKPFDQTRVVLSEIEMLPGSDYINASLVEDGQGKQVYICTQGPLDYTVLDFWRMIWEQNVSVIVMLTCVEEQGQIKCFPYWSDENTVEVDKRFNVTVLTSRRYCDYVVRRIQVENMKSGSKECRDVLHFHYLMWTDFVNLDVPNWILRFVKRVNEHYCISRGPLLVHSSSGVGRTGVFVAVDSLLRQLRDQAQVDIFTTVCKLRKFRNHLVSSLKQYIYIYQALMEQALFGDTEVLADHLKDHVEQLKRKAEIGAKRPLDVEFEKLDEVVEDPKSDSVGKSEVHKNKNRYEFIIPYDYNRVIIPQIPSREHSTYINASYVQGYDRSLLFVITQDPLESTLVDFWRMILEHSISTIVMLSELGTEMYHCTRYWPEEGEEQTCEYVQVLLLSSETWPQFTLRKFSVTNTQTKMGHIVAHFQYLKWPGPFGVVPDKAASLLFLIEQAQLNQELQSKTGPITVHCSGGGDRSGIYVALTSLIQQIRVEERVDVFQAAKYIRSQRECMLQTLPQYEFLYRGLMEYLDSHKIYDMGDTPL